MKKYNFELKQSLAARFLIGVSWGFIYADSIINAREAPVLMVVMTIVTLAFGLAASIEKVDVQ